ncbi:hypothetical protein [Sphaerospermopsis sp. LEGE 08334]|jgi:hypothetical protein|uniref:hypothetical protein n=1 Tax=Sphaerospermopsis sp. LEGE 08334 TaxID=1828651 RepID=UPI001882E005|nr:hypothetical protein [Sphaerospermopsis sp. LEGE 08334]MBE9058511.1 hypothetical protein [Sphaerospermopsis sp. LEGE 08334]
MKKIIIGLLTIILTGCTSVKESEKSTSEVERKISEKPMSENLAILDGKKDPASLELYDKEFKKLKNLCFEDEREIGLMIFKITKFEKEAGYTTYSNFDTLQSFKSIAESYFNRKRGECIQVYIDMTKEYKKEKDEN